MSIIYKLTAFVSLCNPFTSKIVLVLAMKDGSNKW